MFYLHIMYHVKLKKGDDEEVTEGHFFIAKIVGTTRTILYQSADFPVYFEQLTVLNYSGSITVTEFEKNSIRI